MVAGYSIFWRPQSFIVSPSFVGPTVAGSLRYRQAGVLNEKKTHRSLHDLCGHVSGTKLSLGQAALSRIDSWRRQNLRIHVLNTWRSIASLALCMLTGTLSHAQAIQPVPPTPIDIKKVELGGTPWNPQWDQIIEKALPPEMLSSQVPQGVRRFCPQFFGMGAKDMRTFWAYFFQALAGAEAGLNPNSTVRHTAPDGALPMRSEGLLQLAYADHRRYGCDFNWQVDRALKANDPAKTILQPKNNLECGVKILVNQIIVRHKPLLSPSGYWSTLMPGGPGFRVFAGQMTNPPNACGLPTNSPIDKSATTKSVQDDANRAETAK